MIDNYQPNITHTTERTTIDDMWERLTQHQPYADERGYGPEWAKMCAERTADAALAAESATYWIEKAEGRE